MPKHISDFKANSTEVNAGIDDSKFVTPLRLAGALVNVSTAYKGEAALSTNPGTPVSPVYYYAPVAGTYTNFKDSGNASIVVSTGDLTNNKVRLSVNGAVTTKVLEPSTIVSLAADRTVNDSTKASKSSDIFALNNEVAPAKAMLVKTVNLFNYSTREQNASVTSGGLLGNNAGWTREAINVIVGHTYYFYSNASTPFSPNFAFFNSGGTFISGGTANNSGVAPANAAYMYISLTAVWTNVMVIDGSVVPSSFIAYGYNLTTNDANFPVFISTANISAAVQAATNEVKAAIIASNWKVPASQIANLTLGSNLVNTVDANYVSGFFINSATGILTANGIWTATGFIPVSASTQYSQNGTANAAWYDANFGYISAYGTGLSPSNAAYLRTSQTTAALVSAPFMVNAGSSLLSYVAYQYNFDSNYIKLKKADISALVQQCTTEVKNAIVASGWKVPATQINYLVAGNNLFNVNDTNNVLGSFVNEATGVVQVLAGWNASGFISVLPSTQYSNGATAHSAWYDANGVFISAFGSGLSPSNAAFVKISQTTGAWANVVFNAGSSVLPFEAYQFHFDATIKVIDPRFDALKPWFGKKWLPLGDSITLQGYYFPMVKSITGLVEYTTNQGANGQPLASFLTSVTDATIQGADIITCLIGTNDYGHGGYTLGSITDSTSATTIYGGVKKAIDRILTLNPTARLAFFTPTNRYGFVGGGSEPNGLVPNPYGLTIENIGVAMMETCRLLGVPCMDTKLLSGINQYNVNTMTIDGLHPINEGARRIGSLMGSFINQL